MIKSIGYFFYFLSGIAIARLAVFEFIAADYSITQLVLAYMLAFVWWASTGLYRNGND